MEVMMPRCDEIAISMPSEYSPEFSAPNRNLRRSLSYRISTPSMKKTEFYRAKSRILEVETIKSAVPLQSIAIPLYRKIRSMKAGAILPSEPEEDEDGCSGTSTDREKDSDGDDDVEKVCVKPRKPRKIVKKLRAFDVVIEWILFLGTMIVLISSLYADNLKNRIVWGSAIWKWCMLVAVIFCGRLVTKWAKDCIVLLIESRFFFNERVVYFLHGVKGSVRFSIWLGLVLVAWVLLINKNVRISKEIIKGLHHVTKAIISFLVGSIMWMVKTLLLKFIAATFHVKTFFARIREAISDEYVLWTLSVPRSIELNEGGGRAWGSNRFFWSKLPQWMRGSRIKKKKGIEGSITLKRLGRMKPEKMPASTMGQLMDRIQGSKLSIVSCASYRNLQDSGSEQKHITSRSDAEVAASLVFRNVTTTKDQPCYIAKEDLFDFESHENKECLDEWFEKVSEEGKITETVLSEWVVNIYKQREYLSHSLKDAKAAIEELNRILSGIILILIMVVGLLIMGFATTKVIFFLSSQILLVAFMFGNTCRTLFEAMIFVFVMHPFDVGDRCVVDDVQMIVEEMDILKTAFLRYDNEMIYYPNAVLATKAISNFNRSPEKMGDPICFDIDVTTSAATIEALKDKIKEYIKEKSHHWHPDQSLQIKEIENMNKMKMVLCVNHKMNFQDYQEKMNRRTEFMLALRDMIEEIGIKYHRLPQELHTSHVAPLSKADLEQV